MARSIDTIYSLIIAEKTANAELSGLTSSSVTAIYILWAWVTAAVLYTVEVMHDLFRTEIDTLLRTLKPGTLLWYQEMCKSFQYGDALVWRDSGYAYATIDDTKKIVAQCSVTEGTGGLTVKIASLAAGNLQPLSGPEQAAFAAYLAAMKYAGTRVNLVNSNPNLLYLACTVYYDPLILKANGTDILDTTKPVELAVDIFLKQLPFNGRLRKSSLIASMKSATGVVDISITNLQHKYGAGAFVDIPVSAIPESGYFKVDPAHTLTANITYIAASNNV